MWFLDYGHLSSLTATQDWGCLWHPKAPGQGICLFVFLLSGKTVVWRYVGVSTCVYRRRSPYVTVWSLNAHVDMHTEDFDDISWTRTHASKGPYSGQRGFSYEPWCFFRFGERHYVFLGEWCVMDSRPQYRHQNSRALIIRTPTKRTPQFVETTI